MKCERFTIFMESWAVSWISELALFNALYSVLKIFSFLFNTKLQAARAPIKNTDIERKKIQINMVRLIFHGKQNLERGKYRLSLSSWWMDLTEQVISKIF